jgi:hypothetical protein
VVFTVWCLRTMVMVLGHRIALVGVGGLVITVCYEQVDTCLIRICLLNKICCSCYQDHDIRIDGGKHFNIVKRQPTHSSAFPAQLAFLPLSTDQGLNMATTSPCRFRRLRREVMLIQDPPFLRRWQLYFISFLRQRLRFLLQSLR